jgi:hypothetical protein
MFFVELKPVPNNKDIYNIEYLQQCKIKFEPLKHKRDIAQCANCQRYGHTKYYCHLKLKCVKCAGSHPTIQCQHKERLSEVLCALWGGNHPTNYKGYIVYICVPSLVEIAPGVPELCWNIHAHTHTHTYLFFFYL